MWAAHPVVYEVNTWVWLAELSSREQRRVGLADVTAEDWDALCRPGITAVWLMGVWERSPVAASIFRADPHASAEYRSLLPDYVDDDVVGSAYAIRQWRVDPRLGGEAGLVAARAQLAQRGCGLMLDYVPNHVAPDHPWLADHPERFVRGTPDDLLADPAAFLSVDGSIVARGRDPFFPPWPDVAQLDLSAATTRQAAIDVLRMIGEHADAVRCDMAMLALTDVFARTWGSRPPSTPVAEYWDEVIGEVHRSHPELRFVAEAYWGTEPTLLQQGFDACYDKELYDHLVASNAAAVHAHVAGDHANRCEQVRFIENHDEPRAAATFGPDAQRAAAIVVATLPGITLWHDGQFDARRSRLPVTLGRRPAEADDIELRTWYALLLAGAARIRRGAWQAVATTGWPDNGSHQNLVAWSWDSPASHALVLVNLSDTAAQARAHPRWADLAEGSVTLADVLTGERFERDVDDIATNGLYVDLPPWGSHVLEVRTEVR